MQIIYYHNYWKTSIDNPKVWNQLINCLQVLTNVLRGDIIIYANALQIKWREILCLKTKC
ncbi:hypothetical protein OBV_14560 [Oscillibacter valericigenes Sjm18-20]|nr:hypothetical protein OBV_14560 [Oscillibacter valericigenes Sjm18-20]